jgi:hypothetical protein
MEIEVKSQITRNLQKLELGKIVKFTL